MEIGTSVKPGFQRMDKSVTPTWEEIRAGALVQYKNGHLERIIGNVRFFDKRMDGSDEWTAGSSDDVTDMVECWFKKLNEISSSPSDLRLFPVLLSTGELSRKGEICDTAYGIAISGKDGVGMGQRLYLCSEREIKEGDWHFYEGEIKKTTTETLAYISSSGDSAFKKIEFTNDPQLIADGALPLPEKALITTDSFTSVNNETSFLEEFIGRYNEKNIDDGAVAEGLLSKEMSKIRPTTPNGFRIEEVQLDSDLSRYIIKKVCESYHEQLNSGSDADKTKNEAVGLIRYFVERVEKGEIRSRKTYAKYKSFLRSLDNSKNKATEEIYCRMENASAGFQQMSAGGGVGSTIIPDKWEIKSGDDGRPVIFFK